MALLRCDDGVAMTCADHVGLRSSGAHVCERDQGLELVTARFAFPEMPHAMSRQVLRPFRQEDRVSTLGAMIEGSSLGVFSGARGSELHDVFPPVFFLTSLPLPD